MSDPLIAVSAEGDPAFERLVGDGLAAHNRAAAGYSDHLPLSVTVRAEEGGPVVGGLTGRTSLGLMFVDLVWLPQSLRGSGLGTRMMQTAEAEAIRRGCRAGVLYTISFQAPGFYQRLGWRVFGEIPCDPPGTSRVFLTKDFSAR